MSGFCVSRILFKLDKCFETYRTQVTPAENVIRVTYCSVVMAMFSCLKMYQGIAGAADCNPEVVVKGMVALLQACRLSCKTG